MTMTPITATVILVVVIEEGTGGADDEDKDDNDSFILGVVSIVMVMSKRPSSLQKDLSTSHPSWIHFAMNIHVNGLLPNSLVQAGNCVEVHSFAYHVFYVFELK